MVMAVWSFSSHHASSLWLPKFQYKGCHVIPRGTANQLHPCIGTRVWQGLTIQDWNDIAANSNFWVSMLNSGSIIRNGAMGSLTLLAHGNPGHARFLSSEPVVCSQSDGIAG